MPRGRPEQLEPAQPRLLLALDAAWGAWLLGRAPGRLPLGKRSRPLVKAIVRILGARQLTQATLIAARPSASRIIAGAAVDGLHAASMVLLARTGTRMSRPALASAAVAALLSSYGLRCGLRRR